MGLPERDRRNAFLYGAGINPTKVFACNQTHSRNVVYVDTQSPHVAPETDGLVSADIDAYLSVTVADCLPIYLFDTKTGVFGIVHSGREGTGIVLNALDIMQKAGTRPEMTAAVFGPCICGDCYRVDEARSQIFEAAFGGASPLGDVVTGNCLNLQAANALLLAHAGVRNIAVCENCTFTDERLGSYRRERKPFTRMLALVGNF
jgi:YfiH family protein